MRYSDIDERVEREMLDVGHGFSKINDEELTRIKTMKRMEALEEFALRADSDMKKMKERLYRSIVDIHDDPTLIREFELLMEVLNHSEDASTLAACIYAIDLHIVIGYNPKRYYQFNAEMIDYALGATLRIMAQFPHERDLQRAGCMVISDVAALPRAERPVTIPELSAIVASLVNAAACIHGLSVIFDDAPEDDNLSGFEFMRQARIRNWNQDE